MSYVVKRRKQNSCKRKKLLFIEILTKKNAAVFMQQRMIQIKNRNENFTLRALQSSLQSPLCRD